MIDVWTGTQSKREQIRFYFGLTFDFSCARVTSYEGVYRPYGGIIDSKKPGNEITLGHKYCIV